MNKKTTGIVAYITWIGWIVAYCAGDKEGAKFHLNQAAVVWIMSLAYGFVLSFIFGLIPFIGDILNGVAGLLVFACWLMGLIFACKDEEKEIPIIGSIKLFK